jgi:coproporphyrinogen III oxidase-like Fe-S oxidoreductase
LEVLGRDHSASDGVMLLKSAIKIFGSDAVSVDLLFRKPGDTLQSWKDELIQILTFKPMERQSDNEISALKLSAQ